MHILPSNEIALGIVVILHFEKNGRMSIGMDGRSSEHIKKKRNKVYE